MAYTLANLLSPETSATIRARLLAELNSAGAPTDDWAPSASGGMENLRLDVVSGAIANLIAGRVAELARDGLLDKATGDGLKFYAKSRYQVEAREATKTIQNVGLYLVGGSAKQFTPGSLVVSNPVSGRRYKNLDAGTVKPEHTLSFPLNVRFEAEAAGSVYDDAIGTINVMVTAPSGVRCISRRPGDFTEAKVTGVSTGTVAARFRVADSPPTFGSIRVRITSPGEVGTAAFRYTTDGGVNWSDTYPVSESIDIPGGTGATLTFTNGVSPSFIQGDIFTMLVADAILSRGTDAESEPSIRARCRGKWTTLTLVPLAGTVELWAKLASNEVERVLVDASVDVPGAMVVTIASATGPASAQAILDVEDYITLRLSGYRNMVAPSGFLSPEEKALVSSATPRQITAGGTVSVPRAKVPTVQALADAAWVEYLRTLPLGAHPQAVVRLSELAQAVMDAGAVDIQDPTLNGAGANVVLATHEVAVPADNTTLVNTLRWRPV